MGRLPNAAQGLTTHKAVQSVRAGGVVKIPCKMSADKGTIQGVIYTDMTQAIIASISSMLSPRVQLAR